MLKYLQVECLTWCDVNIIRRRTEDDLRSQWILILLPEDVFQRKIFSTCDLISPNVNVTPCHVLRWTLTVLVRPLFPVGIMLVNSASFMLRDTCRWTDLIPFMPLASRHGEMRVNWISVVSDRSIMVRGLAIRSKTPNRKGEQKDEWLGLYSSYSLKYTATRDVSKYKRFVWIWTNDVYWTNIQPPIFSLS